jgi:CubicO group peptidase (beta-lactamase class C family)
MREHHDDQGPREPTPHCSGPQRGARSETARDLAGRRVAPANTGPIGMTNRGFVRRVALLAVVATMIVSLASGAYAAATESAATSGAAPGSSSRPSVVDGSKETPALTAADLEPWLDGHLSEALQTNKVAGAAVVVVKDGRVLLKKGYGYADVAAKKPVDPDRTAFRPASISKLFTGTALMQLVEEGKVSLDEDINTYLDFPIDGMNGSAITVRHLMTHTAGFEETASTITSDDPRTVVPLEKFVKRAVPQRIFMPGSTPAYSNYGATLAGYIVQRVSGMSFYDYIDRRLFAPLGMSSSSFRQPPPPALLAAASRGYREADQPPIGPEYFSDVPAGSLTATPADMAKFMIEHLQNDQAGKGVLLKPETATMMHRTITRKLPDLNGMALQFYESNLNGHRVIGHGGDITAFHSDLKLFIDDSVGVFISMNSAGNGATDIRTRLMTAFGDRYFPGEGAPGKTVPVAAEIAKKHAQDVAGEYVSSRGAKTTFIKLGDLLTGFELTPNDDGTLTASTGQLSYRLTETGPYIWEEEGTDTQLQVVTQRDGTKVMSLSDYSPIIVYIRASAVRSPAFLTPTVGSSLIVLLITLLWWPMSALLRRRYGVTADWKPREKAPVLARRIGSVALLIPVGAWSALVASPILNGFTPDDTLVVGVQVTTIMCVVTAAVAVALSTIGTIRHCRSSLRWGSTVIWTVAVLFLISQYYAFNMLKINTSY